MVCLSVYLTVVTLVSPAKLAQPIELLFGLLFRVGPRNYVLDGVPDPLRARCILGVVRFIKKH